jgi:flagellar basal body-associated protein FliL
MKKALMIVALVAIVAISGSMIYYFVFFRTEKERTETKLQEQKEKEEAEKYIIEYNALLVQSESETKKEISLDETIDFALEIMAKVQNLYVPETCDTLHNLQMQYWQIYYSSLLAYKNNDNKKGAELSEKTLELANLVTEETRKLLRFSIQY